MKLGSKVTAAVLLFVALVLINYLASSLPVRIDATADDIYTLSDGTKSLLKKVEEPIQLDFYFSKSVEGLPVNYKNFATRVQEMLRQYVRASNGKIQLNVIDPKADTPEEEKASAAGLSPQMLPTGERVYFGLVGTLADQQKNIPAFSPQREQFLEYDLSQLVYTLQEVEKKKLGLLTSLPLRGTPPNPMMMMRQQQRESQFVLSEWERSFELVNVEPSMTELPANLDALAIIHPQNVSPKLQYAIDQFVLSGKPVFIAVDPSSQHFKRQGGQMAMFGGPQPNVTSDLPELLKAYGVTYNPQTIVGDLENAAQVGTGDGQVVRYPIWLWLTKTNFNSTALPTAQLDSLWFIEAGSFSVKAVGNVKVTPLVETSALAGEVQSMAIGFAQPDEIARQITPSGKKTVAALIQGKLKSAFPNGAPKDPEPEKKDGAVAPSPTPAPTSPAGSHLSESKESSTIILVADTDWLMDDYSVRRIRIPGLNAAEPLNDNLSFGSNSLEFLSGSQDLISIRGKGTSIRPFTVVRQMEVEANQKYQEQLVALEARISEVQKKLTDLQGKKTEGNRLVASPEVAKAIEDFRKQEAQMRAERRAIRKALREDIERLGNVLLAFNLLASPALLIGIGFWYNKRRKAA
jgi:ABC-type uncharacterized transport system involved in gliding motility auxiliary subunit